MCIDLPNCATSFDTFVSMYADDTKFAQKIRCQQDHCNLQTSIDNLTKWSDDNRLTLNLDKCKYVCYSNKTKNVNIRQYYIKSSRIQQVESHIDLGILFDNQLTFKPHIASLLTRTKSLYGAAYRFCKEIGCMRLIQKVTSIYILPIIEYASLVWDQHRIGINSDLENVLHKMSRNALNLPYDVRNENYMDFNSRMNLINMLTTKERRIISSILFVLKIQRGELQSDLIQIINASQSHNTHHTRRPNLFEINQRILPSKSPMYIAMTNCNEFKHTFNVTDSIEVIKTKLKKYFLDQRTPSE